MTYLYLLPVVVGVITGVSPILSYNVPRVIESIRKRLVTLSNCRGLNITLTLWGEAADRFDGDDVYSRGQAVMVVGVFVGTTIHVYGDSKQLTGGYSCKWYMDEDIPEINMLRSSYKCLRNFTLVVSWPPPHITPS